MKTIKLKLQRLGKRKIKTLEIETSQEINKLKDLLVVCVQSEVERFNKDRKDKTLLPFLSPHDIQNKVKEGKVGFGDIDNEKLANKKSSLEVVLQAFEDGLFMVFLDDEEISNLETVIELESETKITFLRLTFLTGTYW